MSAKLLNDWLLHTTRKASAHVRSANQARRFRYAIGLPSVVLSTTVGAAVFSEFQRDSGEYKIPILIVVLAAAALTALQTFFNFGEREQTHQMAGKKYAQIRRKIQKHICQNLLEKNHVDDIEAALNEVKEIEPSIPEKIWKSVKEEWTLESIKISND